MSTDWSRGAPQGESSRISLISGGCGGRNKTLAVMDTEDGHVVITLPIGGGTDAAAYDPETHLTCSSNGDGNITVIIQEARTNTALSRILSEFW